MTRLTPCETCLGIHVGNPILCDECGTVMLCVTPNQKEVLLELEGCEQMKYGGRVWTLPDGTKRRMFTPMEFGGMNGSHHSATATALAKQGFVDRFKYTRHQLNKFNGKAKGACVYALTGKGRQAVEILKGKAAADEGNGDG